MSTMYRQGDLLLRQVAGIPIGAVRVVNEARIVLAHGEATGHAHAIDADSAREFGLAGANGVVRRFLDVSEQGAIVTHEEHAPIPLPAGLYEIVRQRAYAPMGFFNPAEDILNVSD